MPVALWDTQKDQWRHLYYKPEKSIRLPLRTPIPSEGALSLMYKNLTGSSQAQTLDLSFVLTINLWFFFPMEMPLINYWIAYTTYA